MGLMAFMYLCWQSSDCLKNKQVHFATTTATTTNFIASQRERQIFLGPSGPHFMHWSFKFISLKQQGTFMCSYQY